MALSKESTAFRQSYEVFQSAVDPDTLVTMLYSRFLLTRMERMRATQRTLTTHQQLDVIFDCLERRVSVDPSVFHKLVEVLLEHPALAVVGEKMRG